MIFDCLIIGSGIAGLQCAANLNPSLNVAVICNNDPKECNTAYAQGGVAVSLDSIDVKSHIEDTLKTGAGLCRREAVELLCSESIPTIKEFIERGFVFDGDENGALHYTQEGAHSKRRIIHAGGDRTGEKIEEFLLSHTKTKIFDNLSVSDIDINENGFVNIECYSKEGFVRFGASVLVLAYGGIGSIYKYHTNSKSINGELTGLCIEKGFPFEMMEMTQFHPTVYAENIWARKLLLSEALRGEGAKIVDNKGVRFLEKYDLRGELASRDIISRSMFTHKKETGSDIFLDISNFERGYFEDRFPFIYHNLAELGYDVPKDKIPISPAFHYSIGGIRSDLYGAVEGHGNVYALGECASSGVHGANRLASNSLLEGLVFGKRAALHINENFKSLQPKDVKFDSKIWKKENDAESKNIIRDIMWSKAGIVRTKKGLKEALELFESIEKKDLGQDVLYRLQTAKKIVDSAINREHSIGVHYIE